MFFSLKLEGGGCGSFAASVVSTSGTISEFFPYLWRELYANPRAFGFGLSNLPAEIEPFPVPHPAGKSRDVNLYGLLLFRSWNASPGQGISIRVMDPEMLFLVQRTIARYSLNDIYAENKEEGRKIIASPLMQKRILRDDLNKPRRESSEDQETNIDRTFDQTAANADYGARLWLKKMRDKGLRARGFDFNGQPAILLTR